MGTPAPLNDRPAMICADVVDQCRLGLVRLEPLAGRPRPGRVVAAGELPVGHVVQQRRQFHDDQVGPFLAANRQGRPPDPLDVKPVVARAVARQQPPDMVGSVSGMISCIVDSERERFSPWYVRRSDVPALRLTPWPRRSKKTRTPRREQADHPPHGRGPGRGRAGLVGRRAGSRDRRARRPGRLRHRQPDRRPGQGAHQGLRHPQQRRADSARRR